MEQRPRPEEASWQKVRSGNDHHCHDDCEHHGGGRLGAYWLFLVLLNALLAVYALYAYGLSMQFDWSFLSTGNIRSVAETVFQLLLLASPAILTILLNRMLLRLVRGHRWFPRGTGFAAFFAILVVQAIVIWLILTYGRIDTANGFQVDSIARMLP